MYRRLVKDDLGVLVSPLMSFFKNCAGNLNGSKHAYLRLSTSALLSGVSVTNINEGIFEEAGCPLEEFS